jgi:hypothetical protein
MSQSRQDGPGGICPECGERTGTVSLETHLRQNHHIYLFRSVRYSYNDALAILLKAVCSPVGDTEAWQLLETMAREQHGTRAEVFLASMLSAALGRLEAGERARAESGLGKVILAGGDRVALASALAADPEVPGRELALALAARMAPPLPERLQPVLRLLLQDRRLPLDEQLGAAAVLLRSCADQDVREGEILNSLTEGLGTVRAVERLSKLRERVGPRPGLLAHLRRLEARMRMRCPRCGLELRRPEMIDHLWREHGLLLDGDRVREPWAVLGDWLEARRGKTDPVLVAHCRAIARQVDPENGPARVNRLILRTGVKDSEARPALLAEAERRRASLCPACHAFVPVPRPLPPPPLNLWHGRLSAHGYRLELSEQGLRARLEMATPRGSLYQGPSPDQGLTWMGALWLRAGPLVLLALALAFGTFPFPGGSLLPVLVLQGLAFGIAVGTALSRRRRASLPDRAVDLAWVLMAPRLHRSEPDATPAQERPGSPQPAGSYVPEDGEFLAGLALVSLDRGSPLLRRASLMTAINRTEQAAASEIRVAPVLAALRRLAIHDAVAEGKDPVPLVVAELADCLEGHLPLAYGEALLNDWKTGWWTPGNLQRLRVLLCDRAFEAGFEVSHLLETGGTFESLGTVLEVDNPRGLVLLRLLWSMRAGRPWDRVGAAVTVFERATDSESEDLLARFPDLLLIDEDPFQVAGCAGDEMRPLQILVCGRGIVLQGVLFERKPSMLEVAARGNLIDQVHELHLGGEVFQFVSDPEKVVPRLERWFRFLFNDFLPRTAAVSDWQSPDIGAGLRARGAIPCPECNTPVLPRSGKVGKRG